MGPLQAPMTNVIHPRFPGLLIKYSENKAEFNMSTALF